MGREIKFRAWNEKTRRFTKDSDNAYLCRNDSDIIVEQFTGLKDKNGKEIYEGDIVRFGIGSDETVGVVNYSDDFGSYEVFTSKGYILQTLFATKGEVIGNIHKNPELC